MRGRGNLKFFICSQPHMHEPDFGRSRSSCVLSSKEWPPLLAEENTVSVDGLLENKVPCIQQTIGSQKKFGSDRTHGEDLILGMPWLHHIVDWKEGSLKSFSHHLKVMNLLGIRIIKSAGTDSNGTLQLDCSALLQEFADVEAEPFFPEPRNHAIGLEPGITPKMGPIYKLAPNELQEQNSRAAGKRSY
eukprot:396083-Pelagomonas_calceolata.AAC.1